MESTVFMGGEDRPVAYSMRMQYVFETTFSRSFVSAIAELAALDVVNNDPMAIGTEGFRAQTHMVVLAQIIWSALAAGHAAKKQRFDADIFEVVGWIDDADQGVIASIMRGIFDASPREKEEEPDKKKALKKKYPLKRTGMR